MSDLVILIALFIIISIAVGGSAEEENKLKNLSIAWVIILLITFPTLSTEWARMTSELIDDEGDPRYGLPDIWDGKQVVCFHFPEGNAPDGYEGARYHIDSDGTHFMTDSNWNQTGACIGGFSGFDNGLALMDEAVAVSGGNFAYNSTQYTFGMMINSIAEVNPCEISPCSETSGASWALFHNGPLATAGISDLALEPDSVITWSIETW